MISQLETAEKEDRRTSRSFLEHTILTFNGQLPFPEPHWQLNLQRLFNWIEVAVNKDRIHHADYRAEYVRALGSEQEADAFLAEIHAVIRQYKEAVTAKKEDASLQFGEGRKEHIVATLEKLITSTECSGGFRLYPRVVDVRT